LYACQGRTVCALGAVCSLWIVNQVLVRFGRAGRLGGFCLAATAVGQDRQGWSVTGWPRVSDLGGCWGLRERGLALPWVDLCGSERFGRGCSVQGVWKCVLSERLCCGTGLIAALRVFGRWMAPVHGGSFLEVRAGLFRGVARGVIAPVRDEYEKGIGWMPWHQEAMKDVARCENLGGAASGR